MPLTQAELEKLANICARLGSVFDGERASAALLADRFVRERGLSWLDVLRAEPAAPAVAQPQSGPRYWKHTAEEVLYDHGQALRPKEQQFIQDILFRGYRLSEKQEHWLRALADRTGVPQW